MQMHLPSQAPIMPNFHAPGSYNMNVPNPAAHNTNQNHMNVFGQGGHPNFGVQNPAQNLSDATSAKQSKFFDTLDQAESMSDHKGLLFYQKMSISVPKK